MNISWDITDKDIQNIKKVLIENENPFLINRRKRNVQRQNIVINEDAVIKTMIACLLTSQQRSGPNSAVGRFLSKEPFHITFESISNVDDDIEDYLKQELKKNDLTRYVNRISRFFASNIKKIRKDNWSIIKKLESLKYIDSKEEERKIADKLNNDYDGFGPKQARNFLQSLGLTRYEIPIDSRITNWLNTFGFPVSLSSSSLGDKGYYHFVSDGIQELCRQAEIYPCILDAAIFSSFDNGAWTDENAIF